MWVVRLILLALLAILIGLFAYFLARRRESEAPLENRPLNLLGVIIYNLACYLLVGLPADPTGFSTPRFLTNAVTRTGFGIAGPVLVVLGIVLFVAAVRQRKTVGAENVKEGLLTGGVYRIARHPIYAGIVLVSCGLALARGTWDGLLMVPFVWLVNAAEASIEEIFDIGARYPAEYAEYRKQVGMFGPVSVWAALLVSLVGLAIAGSV